jgi:uncharacterized protein (DUF433 family)
VGSFPEGKAIEEGRSTNLEGKPSPQRAQRARSCGGSQGPAVRSQEAEAVLEMRPLVEWRHAREDAMREYVERRDGGYWITGSRVSLDSIVYAFLRGASPESIAHSFPLITLEDVYGATAFYLAHQAEIDTYLRQGGEEFEALRKQTREANPVLYKKLEEARQRTQTPGR